MIIDELNKGKWEFEDDECRQAAIEAEAITGPIAFCRTLATLCRCVAFVAVIFLLVPVILSALRLAQP